MKPSDKQLLYSRQKLLKSDKAGAVDDEFAQSGTKKHWKNLNIRQDDRQNPVSISISDGRLKL